MSVYRFTSLLPVALEISADTFSVPEARRIIRQCRSFPILERSLLIRGSLEAANV